MIALATIAALSLATPAIGNDSPFSYSYIEVGARRFNVDNLNGNSEDIDAYYGKFSLNFGPIFGFVGYESQDVDGLPIDANRVDLGVGGHVGVLDKLDLVGQVAWLYNDVSASGGGTKGGYEAKFGARWMVLDLTAASIELNGNVIWIDLENRLSANPDDAGFEVGGRVHFLKMLSAGLGYARFEDDDQIGLDLRFSF